MIVMGGLTSVWGPHLGAAFVCAGERCSLPVTDASGLIEAVRAMR